MSFCVICTDLFDGVECLVTPPCGHVFHSNCLTKWIIHSGTCPECRLKIKQSDLILLYFNINVKDQAINPNCRKENENLRAQLAEKDKLLKETAKKVTDLRAIAVEHEDTIASLQAVQISMQTELTVYKDKLRSSHQYEKRCLKLDQQNRILMDELELLNDVKTVVGGTKNDAEKIFQETNSTTATVSDARKKLATYCSILKRELQSAVKEKQTLRNDLTELKKKYGLLRASTKQCMSRKETPSSSPLSSEVRHSKLQNTPNVNLFKPSSQSSSVTPVTVGFAERPPSKLNIVNLNKNEKSVPCPALKFQRHRLAPIITHKKDTDSISTTGYNGFGGHSTVVQFRVDVKGSARAQTCEVIVPKKRKLV